MSVLQKCFLFQRQYRIDRIVVFLERYHQLVVGEVIWSVPGGHALASGGGRFLRQSGPAMCEGLQIRCGPEWIRSRVQSQHELALGSPVRVSVL